VRLVLPIGAPFSIGANNYSLLAAQGSYGLSGKDAALSYASAGSLIDPRTLNSTNTGAVLGALTNSTVNSITAPGTYQNINYTNGMVVTLSTANINGFVLFRNCRFSGGSQDNTVMVTDGFTTATRPTNVFFEYCTFDDLGTGVINGLTGAFNTATRCWFKGYNNCLQLYEPCTILECANDGNMKQNAAGNAHYDCVENNGTPNVTIQSCKFINNFGQTSAIMNNNEFGDCYNINIDNCYLEGGGLTVYMDGSKSTIYRGDTVRITRSILKAGQFGYLYDLSRVGSIYMPTTGPDANTLI
jgi:hypothetical protein